MPVAINRVINLEDFEEPAVRGTIRDIFEQELGEAPEFPSGREHRKQWEVAMAVLSMREHGILHPQAQILGIGAGTEATGFWLTNHVGRVWMTDLYASPGAWDAFAPVTMMWDPASHWKGAWNPRHLTVQHMDARWLVFEDNTFDAVFASSSIEHFGSLDDIGRAMDEACRVLKPGGIASFSTEFLLEGDPQAYGTEMLLFDRQLIERILLGGRDWAPVTPLDYSISQATIDSAVDEAVAQKERLVTGHDAEIRGRAPDGAYPHCVLRHGANLFTSIHLAFRKNGVASTNGSTNLRPAGTAESTETPEHSDVGETAAPETAATPETVAAPLPAPIAPKRSRAHRLRNAVRAPYHPLVWRLNRNDQNDALRTQTLTCRLDEVDRQLGELTTRNNDLSGAIGQLHEWMGAAGGELRGLASQISQLQEDMTEARADGRDVREALADWAAVLGRTLADRVPAEEPCP